MPTKPFGILAMILSTLLELGSLLFITLLDQFFGDCLLVTHLPIPDVENEQ